MILFSTLIVFLAFTGFVVAGYVYQTKRREQPFVCPFKARCENVVYSDYSRFLGIPVELLGLVYYAIIALGYGAIVVVPSLGDSALGFILFALSVAAFCFSLYLTFIQAFVLREWCSWCLASAALCFLILVSALASPHSALVPLLGKHIASVSVLQALSVALGLGAATVMDVLFLRFLKDLRLSKEEADVLHSISQVVWFALAAVILMSIGMFIPVARTPEFLPGFLMQMIISIVLIPVSAWMHFLIGKKLVGIALGEPHNHEEGELHALYRRAFALGAVSLVSWYMLLFVSTFGFVTEFGTMFVAYVVIGALCAWGSRFFEYILRRNTGL